MPSFKTRTMIAAAAVCGMTIGFATPQAFAADVQVQTTGPVVELTITEAVKARPDIATIGAGVSSEAPTAVEAMRINAREMASVIARLKALGIDDADIQTTGINLNARFDYDRGRQQQVFRGYQASNRVSVTLRDVEATGRVLDALVAAGATDLNGPRFAIDDDTSPKAQARKAAMQTAQAQALEYARGAGYSGVRLLMVSENIRSSQPQPMAMMAREEAIPVSATPVQPGMVSSGVTVNVTYEMTR